MKSKVIEDRRFLLKEISSRMTAEYWMMWEEILFVLPDDGLRLVLALISKNDKI